jgi:hypothetical protein
MILGSRTRGFRFRYSGIAPRLDCHCILRFYVASRAAGKLKLLLGGFRVPVED